MPTAFKLPEVGENIEKADIGNLHVAVGDTIAADQVVMEIETDKAVFDLPCPIAGKVAKIHVKPGDSVAVGAVLLTIEEEQGADTKPAPAPQGKPAAKSQPVAPAKPEKSSPAQKPAPVPVASPATSRASAPVATDTVTARSPEDENGDAAPPAPAGPATRRLARELGVDLHQVSGSGPGGRITSEDVQTYVRDILSRGAPTQSGTAGAIVAPPLPDFSSFGQTDRQALNKLMRVAAANLGVAWNVIPHVTQHELADVTELEAARKRYSHSGTAREGNPKITMTVLAMKAVVIALKSFPRFNASFDAATGEVVLKKYFHIGVAVDTEQGLVVPVVRNADTKSVVQLAGELADLAKKARDRKLAPGDMQGGSFTITNLGGIGGTYFTPIVNWPEVAILGMSRTSQQQVVVDGVPQVRLMLPLSLSYDHRVINGADAARFIVKLAGLLSDPFQLLSEV